MAKTKRKSKNLDIAYIGYQPDWSTIESSEDERFQTMLADALRNYGYFNSIKDLKKNIIQFLTDRDVDKPTIKLFKRSPDWRAHMTACSLATAYCNGMPEYPKGTEYIMKTVNNAIAAGEFDEEELETKKDKPKQPSIQDRINTKVNDHILHFEIEYEDGIIERKEKHPKPDTMSYLRTNDVPSTLAARIASHFQAQWDEIKNSQGKNADEQLAEAYAHLNKADVKRFTDFYKALITDLEMYQAEKKITKAPRKRKAVSKTKQIAKLKFMKLHDQLKLVSIKPEDIIDAKELWVFNTKTRKLGKYVTDEYSTLGVKGTTIVGFDSSKSVAKTLRKPKEQLAEFNKTGKVKLRKFLENIKAVDIKLTGRINGDIILLKVH